MEQYFFLLFTVCPSGSYYITNNVCTLCPVDTYGSGTNANSCTDCPAGTNTQGQTGKQHKNHVVREVTTDTAMLSIFKLFTDGIEN